MNPTREPADRPDLHNAVGDPVWRTRAVGSGFTACASLEHAEEVALMHLRQGHWVTIGYSDVIYDEGGPVVRWRTA